MLIGQLSDHCFRFSANKYEQQGKGNKLHMQFKIKFDDQPYFISFCKFDKSAHKLIL